MKKKSLLLTMLLISLLLIPVVHPYTKGMDTTDTSSLHKTQNYPLLYRVTPPLHPDDVPFDTEIVGGNPGIYHDVLLYGDSISLLRDKGYFIEILTEDTASINPLNSNQYHTFASMEEALFEIAEDYENITSLVSIGKSYEDRDIWCLEISDNPGVDEQEPGVLLLGLHHAREWPTLEICVHIAENLTERYLTDTIIHDLIQSRRIWIIPCVNPDGYHYCHDQGHDWRKNRHYLEDQSSYGIDLNRNYAGSTNVDPLGMWGSTGMSHNPDSGIYCGENQFSELETQAIKQFFLSHDISACISWHTYSELVMWPWGYSIDVITPDDAYMSAVGIEMASRITKQSGSGTYLPHQSAGLYPTTGDTTDWMYGYSHYVLGKTCFAYTIEACASFHPGASVLPQVCKENMDGALYLIKEAYNISQMQQRVISPTIYEISDLNETYTLSWEVLNHNANASKYEIQELTNMFQYTDTATVSPEGWILDGFSCSISESFSNSRSYQSHTDARAVSAMTTRYPTYITGAIDTVSFYCWYDISENNNEAFFEISTNGRDFTVIDIFSGESDEWERKEYSLQAYKGESIYLRFRYAKSSKNIEEGFYVDNITPVTLFYTVNTLDDTITDQNYDLPEKQMEDYFIRIRGYNDVYGWGDWSKLYPLQRMYNGNNPPEKPVITGPQQPSKGEPCTYTMQSFDPNEDDVYYFISWGDNTQEEWVGPYQSGENVSFTHTWERNGQYQINVKTRDEAGMTSEWSTFPVTLPKYKGLLSIWDQLLSYVSLFFNLFDPSPIS